MSRTLTPMETKYSPIEKLCLALYFACSKLRHYVIQENVYIVSQIDLIKFILNRPVISGRIGKWPLAFAEFTLIYFPQKTMKGQALADFLVDHTSLKIMKEEEMDLQVYSVETQPWILKFDGSSTESSAGAGIVIVSPLGVKTTLSFNLDFDCTNNQAEYEALVIGLEILQELRAGNVLIMGDS